MHMIEDIKNWVYTFFKKSLLSTKVIWAIADWHTEVRSFREKQGKEVKRVKVLKHNLSRSDPTPSYRKQSNMNCQCVSVRLIAVSKPTPRHFTMS